jgi:hypothetical protein
LHGSRHSGDVFAAALDQENKSQDKENASDDSDQGCIIHLFTPPWLTIGRLRGIN